VVTAASRQASGFRHQDIKRKAIDHPTFVTSYLLSFQGALHSGIFDKPSKKKLVRPRSGSEEVFECLSV